MSPLLLGISGFLLAVIGLWFVTEKSLGRFLVLGGGALALTCAFFWEWARERRLSLLLAGTREQAAGILEQLPEALLVYGKDQRLLLVNQAAERLFGISRRSLAGTVIRPELETRNPGLTLFLQTFFPSLAPKVKKISSRYPEVLEIEFAEPKPLVLLVTTIPFRSPQGEDLGFVKIVRDVTRESELSKMKSEFISIAAHQLRTPLAAIRWTFALFTRGDLGELSAQAQKAARDGLTVSEKLIEIVNDFLNVSRIEEGRFGYEFASGDLVALVQKALQDASSLAAKYKVTLAFIPSSTSLPTMRFDAEKLSMALSNIIDNAVKYNRESGKVEVGLAFNPKNSSVELRVEDTGVGIPSHELSKTFTKFFRGSNVVKKETEGSGLGLFIAKNIIEQHGGTTTITSEEGRGTSVLVILPTDPGLMPKEETARA